MSRSQSKAVFYILAGILLVISYVIYKVSKGKFFSEIHTPRPVKTIVESEDSQKFGIALFVSVLLAMFITNNILPETTYFNRLFKEEPSWVPDMIAIIFICSFGLFHLAFYLTKKK